MTRKVRVMEGVSKSKWAIQKCIGCSRILSHRSCRKTHEFLKNIYFQNEIWVIGSGG